MKPLKRQFLPYYLMILVAAVAVMSIVLGHDYYRKHVAERELETNDGIVVCLHGRPADGRVHVSAPNYIEPACAKLEPSSNGTWCAEIPRSRLHFDTPVYLKAQVTDGTTFIIRMLNAQPDEPPLGPYEFSEGTSPELKFTQSEGYPDAIPSFFRVEVAVGDPNR